ncbi:MAG: hypothetical protein GY708_13855 [Actinomycetia bacterium]|nr:hypothetical protein [Actinomycetes bacterium]MCP4958712.1 hypothetical protein [Actinomycetes bacterium]
MTRFEPPGPGGWDLDLSHFPGGTTPIAQALMAGGIEKAYEDLFAELGVPARTIRFRWVNGFVYTRLEPLVGANRATSEPPPKWVMKVASRVLPEFRRRERSAKANLDNPPWPDVVKEWTDNIEPRLTARNRELQNVDLTILDDVELADHLQVLFDHCFATYREHHRLHGYDMGPVGRFVFACRGWGIDAADAVQTLAGASPHTSGPSRAVGEIRSAITAAGVDLEGLEPDLDAIASVSPLVAQMLDDYMGRHGWVVYTGYDVESFTMADTPGVLARTIVFGTHRERVVDHVAAISELRERVPAGDRSHFDTLVTDARGAMGMRDAQGPITVEWPTGLLRRGMLEAGSRLVAAGEMNATGHVFELTIDELTAAVAGRAALSADELAARCEERAAMRLLDAPRKLGDDPPPPPPDVLPRAMRSMVSVVRATMEEMGLVADGFDAEEQRLSGVGIGNSTFTAIARVAVTPEEALERLDPGDILVTLTTSPAYNLVLSLVGGLVTAEGGPVCHAAVLSRELGIPAVIGATDALVAIPDGSTVEIDPVAGRVRVIDTA